eukprot:1008138_1
MGLNGIKIGDRQLAVRRHTPSTIQQQQQQQQQQQTNTKTPINIIKSKSNVLILSQMVTNEDLKDDQEYQEIVEDIREECSKYGNVKSITIPRPSTDSNNQNNVPGLGKVFIEFEACDQAQSAKDSLQGRTFENKTVFAEFYDAEKYANKDFTI